MFNLKHNLCKYDYYLSVSHANIFITMTLNLMIEEIRKKEKGIIERDLYGWKKCSKSQARRTETERSGSPLWGRHGWLSMIPAWWKAFCCLRHCSSFLSLGVSPFVVPGATASLSPITTFVAWIWLMIPSFKHRKCLDMAFDACVE